MLKLPGDMPQTMGPNPRRVDWAFLGDVFLTHRGQVPVSSPT